MLDRSHPALRVLLSELHDQSQAQLLARARAQFHGSDGDFLALARQYERLAPRFRGEFLAEHGLSAEGPDLTQGTSLSLAISASMGQFLRTMVLAQRASRVLELGSSCGVSTLYLADALARLGRGTVIATELDAAKCARIRDHVAATGLGAHVELREGDVFQTIATLEGPFDLVFIDIWASGYLDAFQRIEALLRPGAVVITDNMYTAEADVQSYKQYLDASPSLASTTLDFESGVELTVVV
jgi:predicted O-methyltransferase YrrM